MSGNIPIEIIRVFVDENGKNGNPLGIIVDEGNKFKKDERQTIATLSGFSEVVFINDVGKGNISIFNPQREIPFAGYALVGVSWFIRHKLKTQLVSLKCLSNEIETWEEKGRTFIRGSVSVLPPWNLEHFKSVESIESVLVDKTRNKKHSLIWCFIDEQKGLIRARTFAPDWGIPEDEANGSGAMKLTFLLKKDLTIIHGVGSVIYTKYIDGNNVSVGGECVG